MVITVIAVINRVNNGYTKKNKKASPKKKQKATIEAITYETIHKNSGDPFGTIKLIKNKFKSSEEYSNFIQTYNSDPDCLPESHLNLINKFKNIKDKKELKFTDPELKLLEKALHNSYSYLGTKIKLDYLEGQLAWANTAFDDNSSTYEKNLSEAGRRLGFTKGTKKPTTNLPFDTPPKGKKRRFDPVEVTSYYKKLIDSGIDRKDALFKCVKKFEFASNNACSAYLRKYGLKNIPQIRESTARLK